MKLLFFKVVIFSSLFRTTHYLTVKSKENVETIPVHVLMNESRTYLRIRNSYLTMNNERLKIRAFILSK